MPIKREFRRFRVRLDLVGDAVGFKTNRSDSRDVVSILDIRVVSKSALRNRLKINDN